MPIELTDWEARLQQFRQAYASMKDGVVALARDVWEFMDTPQFDQLVQQTPPIPAIKLPVMLGAAVPRFAKLAKGSPELLQRFFQFVERGDKAAIKLSHADVPPAEIENVFSEFVRLRDADPDKAAQFVQMVERKTAFDPQAMREVGLDETRTTVVPLAEAAMRSPERPNPNPVTQAVNTLLEQGRTDAAAEAVKKAVDSGAATLAMHTLAGYRGAWPARTKSYLERLHKTLKEMEGLPREERVIRSLRVLKSAVTSQGLNIELAEHATNPYTRMYIQTQKRLGSVIDHARQRGDTVTREDIYQDLLHSIQSLTKTKLPK